MLLVNLQTAATRRVVALSVGLVCCAENFNSFSLGCSSIGISLNFIAARSGLYQGWWIIVSRKLNITHKNKKNQLVRYNTNLYFLFLFLFDSIYRQQQSLNLFQRTLAVTISLGLNCLNYQLGVKQLFLKQLQPKSATSDDGVLHRFGIFHGKVFHRYL